MQRSLQLTNLALTDKTPTSPLDTLIKFPRLSNSELNTSPSPFYTYRSHSQTSSFPIEAPAISYLNYRPYHISQKPNPNPRKLSGLPPSHEFYRPQKLKISPRARLTVFTKDPIIQEESSKHIQIKSFKKKLRQLGRQSKVIQSITKPSPPLTELGPAWSFGEMMWKLSELAPLRDLSK